MKLVKLDAIDSTNDYLKDLVRKTEAENYTVVTAEYQTKGRGQMGAEWISEKGKNLIMSILVKNFIEDATDVFNLNITVALAVIDSLQMLKLPDLSIKWPNDIMAGQKKIGGILIENSFKSDGSIYSIVGLGLNVNQRQFEKLPLASSIAEILGSSIDKQALLNEIVLRIKKNVDGWKFSSKTMTEKYTELLFRRNKWTTFQFEDRSEFCGMVLGISESGKLVIAHESGSNQEYDIKEVKMIF